AGAETVTVPDTLAAGAGAVSATVGGVVSATVTLTAAVAVFPAASRATALTLWDPGAASVVSHATEYGAAVTSAPRFVPSTLNCTPTTPTLSVAVAETVTVPDTLAAGAGALSDTVGRALSTVTLTALLVALFPAASRATAVKVCAPLLALGVGHETVYGAAVSSAPSVTPSSLNCTPTTPTLSVAVAEIVTVPETLAAGAGAVSATVGGVVSRTVVLPAAVAVLPVSSRLTGLPVWAPAATAC